MTVWIALIMSLALVHENALSGALAGLIILCPARSLASLGWQCLPPGDGWPNAGSPPAASFESWISPASCPQPERPRPWPGRFDIRIESLHFSLPGPSAPPFINGLDLSIRQGERLVISGPSGCGKTTLARLIMRQMDPDHGRILLGGIDLRELDSKDLRQRIAWLPQQPVLFQDSLAANLRLAAPAASDEELHQALTAVGLAAFVAQRPNGLDTWIDEAGGNVSGGEKRRIALARLFLTQPDIVHT